MKKDVEINEENVIRTITTYPKEKFVGHWKSGRLYPLYNVVENNGSMFLSLNGKMKEEPFVAYNGETNTFSANEGWSIKEMSADSRLTAMSDTADIQEITALINAAVAPLQEEIDELKSQIRYSTIVHFLTFEVGDSGYVSLTIPKGCVYSFDQRLWKDARQRVTVNLYPSDSKKVYVCGDKVSFANNRFGTSGTGTVSCSGNIMSLYDAWHDVKAIPSNYTFGYAFYGCTNLTSAPELPATTLSNRCYDSMFQGCTSLTSVPEQLPAVNLAIGCYASMFQGCTSLRSSPELPATTLVASCYQRMFKGCTSLISPPTLEAGELVNECYVEMFYDCSSLNYMEALFLTEPINLYTRDWLSGVAASGTFIKNAEAEWDKRGDNAVPDGWEIET